MAKNDFVRLNRAQRRGLEKARPGWMPGTNSERLKALMKNGITPEYVQQERDKAWKEGFMQAGESVVKGCYAAVCLTLHEQYGFGWKRCKRALQGIDDRLLTVFDSQELIDQVLSDMGVTIDFTAGVNRVE